jgi:hypothetical protein
MKGFPKEPIPKNPIKKWTNEQKILGRSTNSQ